MFKIINVLTVLLLFLGVFPVFGQTNYYDNAPCPSREIYRGCQGQSNCPRPIDPRAGDDYFDWTAEDYYFYLKAPYISDIATTTKSPWFTQNNPNVLGFYENTTFQDNKPEDGWELVQRKFGTPTPYGEAVKNPYLILYNKYTGMLRIFVLVTHTEGQTYNNATINLYFLQSTPGNPNYRSGLLENLSKNSYMNALEDFDNRVPVSKVANIFHNGNSVLYWLHADFPMAYDPCTCNFKSNLMFDVSFIKTSTLEFSLRGRATPLNLLGNTGTSSGKTNILQDYMAIGNAIAKAATAGSTAYTSLNKGIGEFKKFVNTDSINKERNILPFILDILPGLPAVASGSNFLISALSGTRQDDNRHLIYDLDLKANGTMKTEDPYAAIDFPMPGGDNLAQIVPQTRLMYNNIMGVATLTKKPTVYWQYRAGAGSTSGYTVDYQLKDEDLEYAINTAGLNLNSRKDKIEVAASLELNGRQRYGVYDQNYYYDWNAEFLTNTPNLHMVDSTLLGNVEFYQGRRFQKHTVRYRTTTYPLGDNINLTRAFNVMMASIKVNRLNDINFVGSPIDSAFVKLVVKVTKSMPDGTKKYINYTARYLANLLQSPTSYPINNFAANQLAEVLDYKMIGYYPNQANGQPQIYNIPQGDTLRIYASGGFILGNFVIDGGGILSLRCFNSDINGKVPVTYVNNDRLFPIPTEAIISYYPISGRIIPPIDVTKTKALCLGNKYTVKVQNSIEKSDDLTVSNVVSENRLANLNIYPNPATDKITFKYDIATKGFVKIVVSNALGVVVAEIVQNESHEIGNFETVLDTNNLSSGVYIASLETAQGRQTQKIVVVK